MNRFLKDPLIIFYLMCSTAVFGAQKTWNGSVSTAWATAGNWTPSGVPASTDTVTIVNASNQPQLAGNTSVNRLTMTSGTLSLEGYELTVSQRIACTGGTITNGKFIVRGAVAAFSGTTFNCKVDVISAQVKLDGGVYNDSCYFEQTGSSTGNGQGGNKFNAIVTLKNSGTSSFQTAIAAVDTFNYPVTIYNSSNSSTAFILSNGYNTVFNDNVIVNNTGSGQILLASTAGSSYCILASGKTLSAGSGTFKRGGLVLNRFKQLGSTTQTISLDSIAYVNLNGAEFNGALTITSPSIVLKSSTFNADVELTKTGLTTNNSDGGNIFYGNLIINNTASNGSAIRMATTTGDVYNWIFRIN